VTHAEDTHDNLDAWWTKRYAALEAERDRYRDAAKTLWSVAKFAKHMGTIDLMPSAVRAYEKCEWLDEGTDGK